jgi:hypothetical protein
MGFNYKSGYAVPDLYLANGYYFVPKGCPSFKSLFIHGSRAARLRFIPLPIFQVP